MSTPAFYTFKGDPTKGLEDLHFVYHSDGYPRGAADIIPDLVKVATRIRAGERIDLESLDLPRIQEVQRIDGWEHPTTVPFRYDIEIVDGRPVVTAYRHEPVISSSLEERLESARQALQAVEDEMHAARTVPTFVKLTSGTLNNIRALGNGYPDE